MSENVKKDETEPKRTEQVTDQELPDETLDEVAGGRMLNPQPLPPRW